MTSNNMYGSLSKRIALFLLVLYFAVCPLFFVKVNSAHALSGIGFDTNNLVNIQYSPFSKLNLVSYGTKNYGSNTINFGYRNSLNGLTFGIDSNTNSLLETASFGYSTVKLNVDNLGNSNFLRNSAIFNWEYGSTTYRGGVATVFDGVCVFNDDGTVSQSKYYDSSGEYNLTQGYNDYNNKLEMVGYNTFNITMRNNTPFVLYCNSEHTNFDIEVGMLTGVSVSNAITSVYSSPENFYYNITTADSLGSYDVKFNGGMFYDTVSYNPTVSNVIYGFDNWVNGGYGNDTWDSFNRYYTQFLNACMYTKTEFLITALNKHGELQTFKKSFLDYGLMYFDGSYQGRHVIPLDDYLKSVVFYELTQYDGCIFVNDFAISCTTYCNGGTYYDVTDDYTVTVGGLFFDVPLYNYGTVFNNNLLTTSQNSAMKKFYNETELLVTDGVTMKQLFANLFEFEIAPGFRLSYLLYFAVGIMMLVLFIRLFR